MRARAARATAWLFGALSAGCGGACPREVAGHRAHFEARPADAQVDGFVEVPFALVDGLLAEVLEGVAPVALPVPGLSGVALAPAALRLQAAAPGQLAFTFKLAVRRQGKVLFDLDTEVEVAPRLEPEEGRLSFTIGPESLRKVAPRLGPEAAAAVARSVRAELPAALRMTLSATRLRVLTDRALEAVVDGAWGLLRGGAAADLLPRTQVHLNLPRLPLRRIELRSQAGWFSVGLHADLGGAGEGPARAPAVRRPPADGVQVRLSGALVAALVNQAIADGALPGRYSEAGKPQASGPLQVGVGWAPGPRPLKVLAWQTEGTCVHARLGGTPSLSVSGRTVKLQVPDGTVEAVEGSWLVQAGAWLTGVWDRSLAWTQTAVAETRFEVAGQRRVLALDRADAGPEGVDFTLKIRP